MDHPAARLALLAIAASLPVPGAAQSIDIRDARATLGQPFELSLRVKGSETGTALLAPHCVEATLDGEALRWQAAQALGDGAVRVRFAATPAIEQPWLHITAALRCGATYVREFTVLAEPASERPATGTIAAAVPRAASSPQPALPITPITPIKPSARPSPPRALPAGIDASASLPKIEPSRASPPIPARSPLPAEASVAPPPAAVYEAAPAHAMSQAFLALWQQDLGELKREQHQSRAQLAGLHNRLERQEQALWSAALGGLAAGVGLVLAQTLVRRLAEARLRRVDAATGPAASGSATGPAASNRSEPDTPPTIPDQPQNPASASPEAASCHAAASASTHAAAPRHAGGARWQGHDFGHAEIDERRHARLFATADAMTTTGYRGASLALLETAAQGGGGKGPGLLLRLLDLYRQLGQPANEERVSAELAGLYPVRPATLVNTDEGRPLEAHTTAWPRIVASWSQADAPEVLAGLLTEPAADAALDLAAFRELVFLHELSVARESQAPYTTRSASSSRPAEDGTPGTWTLQTLQTASG